MIYLYRVTTIKRNRTIAFSVTSDLECDQRMIRTCRSLAAAGYNVTITGRLLPGSRPLKPEPFTQHRIRCLFRKGLLFYAAFNIRLAFRLLFTRADIYVACDLDTILPTLIASALRSKPMVFDSHEYFTEVPELSTGKAVKSIWETIARISVPRADACYTVSESLAIELGGKYNKPFEVVRNLPLPAEPVPSGEPPSSPVMIYQGDLNPGRGLSNVILSLRNTAANLIIAGDGPMKKSLVELATAEGVANRVIFTGRVPPELLSQLTAGSSVGINILDRHSRSYYLSLSNKFFNYIHAGIPQICSDFPEYRKINDTWEVAILCHDDPESIANSVNKLLTDNALWQRMRENCIAASHHLSWKSEEKKLLEIYNGI